MCHSMYSRYNTAACYAEFEVCHVVFAEELRWAAMTLGTFVFEVVISAIAFSLARTRLVLTLIGY